MTDERTQRLVHSRHYCTDRLVEVKGEIARFQDESHALKAKLEIAANEAALSLIRRRRRFLGRRLEELKAERAALASELEASTHELNAPLAMPEPTAMHQ
ncbi:hypothetical protein [Reyranella sp.]|uniref:hypothetical protein n=1 Tax=Reyranella sp. TaxID=1929291 RepID=UPI0040368372